MARTAGDAPAGLSAPRLRRTGIPGIVTPMMQPDMFRRQWLRGAAAGALLLASCATTPRVPETPYGPLVVDWDSQSFETAVAADVAVRTVQPGFDGMPPEGYGARPGDGGSQTILTGLSFATPGGPRPVPPQLLTDVWNPDAASARVSAVRRIGDLEGFALDSGDRTCTVTWFFAGGRCAGRVVSTAAEDRWTDLAGRVIVLATRAVQ